jgi:uncharacterized membrane protein
MKNFFRTIRPAALVLSVLLTSSIAAQAQRAGGAAMAFKRAERIAGKPLTDAQKKAIRQASMERRKAMKPIQDKFDMSVAKALGMTVDQYKAKVKATGPAARKKA